MNKRTALNKKKQVEAYETTIKETHETIKKNKNFLVFLKYERQTSVEMMRKY